MIERKRSFPSASVVVPTFNRLDDLRRVVGEVERQAAGLESPCELVVVDDGSSDGTAEWLDDRARTCQVKVIHQANAGPATARNRGAAETEGDVVLFLGDDTIPGPGWLREHIEGHRLAAEHGMTAFLGYTCFPPGPDSPFLRWINEHGAQFGYALIDEPTRVPFNFFYTSNVSLPRRVFNRLGGFREDFPAAAWEDIEFAYRATAAGMRLRYLPRARTVHHHRIRVGSFCRRQRTSGRSAAIFAGLHPELEGFLGVPCVAGSSWKTVVARPILRAWTALGEVLPGTTGDRCYRKLLDGHYLEGLGEGLRETGAGGK